MPPQNTTDDVAKYRADTESFVATRYPFYWIVRVHNLYTQNMELHFKKAGLNTTSWRVAMLLREHGAMSVSDISNHADVRMPTITRSIYKMQDKGLVTIYQQEADARVSMVEITDTGLELISSIIPNLKKMFDNIYEDVSGKELEELMKTLQKLYTNLPKT